MYWVTTYTEDLDTRFNILQTVGNAETASAAPQIICKVPVIEYMTYVSIGGAAGQHRSGMSRALEP